MKIKLHNKFEIRLRDENIVAYNTLLRGVYTKISKLEQYTSHIAIGTGQVSLSGDANRLTTYEKTFKAQTEEFNFDPENGTLFIKKLVSIDESNRESFSFSELGICASDEFDPEIFNHVLLTDQEGRVVTMTRKEGDALQIRVTIYLELTNEADALFTSGNNKLIGRILGEEYENADEKLYAVRGNNLTPNTLTERVLPDMTSAVAFSGTIDPGDEIKINFNAELGEGETEEIVIVYKGEVCMRLNALEINPPISITESKTSSEGQIIELGKDIKEVDSVELDSSVQSGYSVTNYSKVVGDKIEKPFDQSFNASTRRFVSHDGKLIAFVDSAVHLYRNENNSFIKLNTTQIPPSNIYKLFLMDGIILGLYTESPYIRIFELIGDDAVLQQLSLTNYNNTVYPYDWTDAACTKANNTIILGVIINNETSTPLIVRFRKNSYYGYYDNIERPRITTATQLFSIGENAFSQAMIGILTNTINGKMQFLIEEFYESTSNYGKDGMSAFALLNGLVKLSTSGRAVIAEKSVVPYLSIYYYPDLVSGGNSLPYGSAHYFSKDGNYMIMKNGEADYSIKNFHEAKVFTDFEKGLNINQSEVSDFEFTFDTLLVFTSSSVYGLCLPKQYTRIDNVAASREYSVSYKKYDLLGSGYLEGVKVTLSLTFKNENSTGLSAVRAPIDRIIVSSENEPNENRFLSTDDIRVE